MAGVRCPFCHQVVEKAAYAAHAAEHTKLREDGQQSEYMTLPPEEREQGELRGVPRVYVHAKCRTATEMPDDIIRSYLKNPYLHSDWTYCCGCGTHVPLRECTWTETGQSLQTYKDELRRLAPRPKTSSNRTLLVVTVGIVGAILALVVALLS